MKDGMGRVCGMLKARDMHVGSQWENLKKPLRKPRCRWEDINLLVHNVTHTCHIIWCSNHWMSSLGKGIIRLSLCKFNLNPSLLQLPPTFNSSSKKIKMDLKQKDVYSLWAQFWNLVFHKVLGNISNNWGIISSSRTLLNEVDANNTYGGRHLFTLFVAGICISKWQRCWREFSHFSVYQDSTWRIWCPVALAILPLCLFHSLWSVKYSREGKPLSLMIIFLISGIWETQGDQTSMRFF